MKNKIYYPVRTVQKSNRKIVERRKLIPLTHKDMTAHFPGLVQDRPVEFGGIRLILRVQIMWSCKCFPYVSKMTILTSVSRTYLCKSREIICKQY